MIGMAQAPADKRAGWKSFATNYHNNRFLKTLSQLMTARLGIRGEMMHTQKQGIGDLLPAYPLSDDRESFRYHVALVFSMFQVHFLEPTRATCGNLHISI